MKQILILSLFLLYSGCTSLHFRDVKEDELLSCEIKAKAKSLQLLEQKYRCTGKKE